MFLFQNDYNEICHPKVLEYIQNAMGKQIDGYGQDEFCDNARKKICDLCERDDLSVHFLSGGTQTNLTVIAAALRPYQAVLAAQSAHINVHETGAIEATGHKVLALPHTDGKISAQQIAEAVSEHWNDTTHEHIAQPKMVYLSHPTEFGTTYSRDELTAIRDVCKTNGLLLFIDGARLGYGLAADGNDLQLSDLAALTDAFYIGGTKVGAMFGEAVVISNPLIAEDFRYMIKQRGGMLAKGWLMGLQFEALLTDNLYVQIAGHANAMADRIRGALNRLGHTQLVENTTNQVFAVLPDTLLEQLSKSFSFAYWGRVDVKHSAVRFCTSWATKPESVDALCDALEKLSK